MDAETFRKLLPLEYAQKFLREHLRPDGRALLECRPIKIDKGGITSADGSSTVRMGSTIAVCGIKCQVAMPDVSRPSQGWFVPNVELGPLCASRFRPGPPNEITQWTSHQVNQALHGSIDLEQLCIEEGNAVWVLYVDVVFVSFAGNALDVSLLAIQAALDDCTFLYDKLICEK
jgi:exosome complex component RRP43